MDYHGKSHRLQRTTAPRRDLYTPRPRELEETAPKPRLLDLVRQEIQTRHYSPRTEKAYVHWIKQFIFFHDKRQPDTMGEPEIAAFVSNLATRRKVSASTQSQALSALIFLYRRVLHREIDDMELVRAKRPIRLPLVLSRREVGAVLDHMEGMKG